MEGSRFEPGDEVYVSSGRRIYIVTDRCVLNTGTGNTFKYRLRSASSAKIGWHHNTETIEQYLSHANPLVRLAREM